MSTKRPNSAPKQPTPDLVVDGKEYEIKVAAFPGRHVPDGSEPDFSIAIRPSRQGSKAQWYCAADKDDKRIRLFSTHLKIARMAKEWNQTEAAQRCAMTQPQWSNLENGLIEPLPWKVFEIERAFEAAPGAFSSNLGYGPQGGDTRDLITRTSKKIEDILVHGEWAAEEVMDRGKNPGEVDAFFETIDDIGVENLLRLGGRMQRMLNLIDHVLADVMPKILKMKEAEVNRLKSLADVMDHQGKLPDPEAIKEWINGYRSSPFDDSPFS